MAVPEDVTPQSPIEEQPIIGLIGMGAMGTLYAKHLVDAGWKRYAFPRPNFSHPADGELNRIYVCDLPDKYDAVKEKYKGVTLP